MCGLVALLSKRGYGFNQPDLNLFKQMLTVDQIRGQDATGAFCVHKNKQVSGVKGAFTPWHLFQQPEWAKFEDGADKTGHILVGHNRAATHGNGANPNNAHPFVEEKIILVHNGTLYNHKAIADKDVDSHAVAAAFAKGNYAEVLSDIYGAYVFIWYDMERNQLSIVRNKERPLWKLENDDGILFCSEAWMGWGITGRLNWGKRDSKEFCTEVPVDTVFHYETGGKLVGSEPVKKAVVVYQSSQTVTTMKHSGNTSRTDATVTTDTPNNRVAGLARARAALEAQVAAGRNKVVSLHRGTQDSFRAGQRVLVQLTKWQVDNANSNENQQLIKVFGVTMEPDKPAVDVVGILPSHVTIDIAERWLDNPVSGEIADFRDTTNGGPTITMKYFSMARLVQTHPTGTIAENEWGFIVNGCSCKQCSSAIAIYEAAHTRVKRIRRNDKLSYEVTCADCIEDSIRDEEVKTEFTTSRIASLEKWEQERAIPSDRTQRTTQVQGNSTAH